MAKPVHGLPWSVVGNKIVDVRGRTVLVVMANDPSPVLQLVVTAVNATANKTPRKDAHDKNGG